MRAYEHWDSASQGTIFVPLSISALNVLIFVIYEAFFMTALDKTVEIIRNIHMKWALKSGHYVMYAPAFVWFGKKLETRCIEKEKEERRGLIGWMRFYRIGFLYTLLYAIPAALLIYAQLEVSSTTAEAITGKEKGHLLYVDLENLLQMKEPDRQLVEFRKNVKKEKIFKLRIVSDSRIVHYPVYEVQDNPKVGEPCKPGSIILSNSAFQIVYFKKTEKNQDRLGPEATVSNTQLVGGNTSKTFTNIACNKTYGVRCLSYRTKRKKLDVTIGKQTEDKNVLNTTKEFSDRFARIYLHRNWKKGEAKTLIQLLLPIVNERYDDDPVVVIDSLWSLCLRKFPRKRTRVVPEECELVTRTTMTLHSIIIFVALLVITVIFVIGTRLWKWGNERTVLNESGTTKGLLWSYANELVDESTGCNRAPEESPKIFISTGPEEWDYVRSELVDVRPVCSQTKSLEFS